MLKGLSPRAVLVVLGCLVCQMGAGFFYATRALAPDLIADLDWTRTMWSSAMAPMLLVSSIAQAVVGSACGRFGVRPVLVFSLSCLLGTFVVLSNVRELWHLYVAVMLLALGNAGIGDVVIGSVITQWFERARGVALGLALVGSNLGGVVFVHRIAAVSTQATWRETALWVGVVGCSLILPFALFAVREPRPGDQRFTKQGEGSTAVGASDEPELASGSVAETLRAPAFWILFYVLFAYAFAQLGMVDHLILYLIDLGYSKVDAASSLELALGAGIVAKVGAGVIALRIAPKKALIANTALLTLSVALVPFADRPGILPLVGVLFGVSTAARDVLFPLLVAQVFGVRRIAQVYGLLMISYFPGGGLGPLMLARFHDVAGSYEFGFLALALLIGLATLSLFAIGRTRARVVSTWPGASP